MLVSKLQHGSLQETTRSLICLHENVMIFRTQFCNQGTKAIEICFHYDYHFSDKIDPRLNFPHMSHFNWQAQAHAAEAHIHLELLKRQGGVSFQYQIGKELGEVRLQSYPECHIDTTSTKASCTQQFRLEAGQSKELCFWLMLSDRRKFTHFPDYGKLETLEKEHLQGWERFWSQSKLEFEDARLSDFRQSCLYGIRCNASPWSIPPNYAPSYWEGRTFHDELYPFLGLLSAGYLDLARRIPKFRLNTLPVALQYGGGEVARFPWESLETGEEGGPYGPWLDERFHVGQFSELAWRYFLYTQDLDSLRDFYPLLRSCADLFVEDVLIRDEHGRLSTRRVTDFDEVVYPVANGIFTISAAIRSLENAAAAAQRLELDKKQRMHWQALAQDLRTAMPKQDCYRVADDAPDNHWHIAQVGPMFPFAIDVSSELARTTLEKLHRALATEHNVTAGTPEAYKCSHWMWAAAMLATAYFLQGRGEEGNQLLAQTLNTSSPFLSPNEQWREGHSLPFIPWFTTSAGAIVFAMHSIFVQVDARGSKLFAGLAHAQTASFEGLLASEGVRVSAKLEKGKLMYLAFDAPEAKPWGFYLNKTFADSSAIRGERSGHDEVFVFVELAAGKTVFYQEQPLINS